ncbi:hypothetical protein ACIQ57_21795 [Lysinibacillus xylanilyticus]|uniref:hypothetical protein n=1 Tax=Lysinibacillus xylanilyticus TaxID=582475 RepID=UPI003827E9E7
MNSCRKNCSCSCCKPLRFKAIDVCQIPTPPSPCHLICNDCIPRTGELVINGGFEDLQPFFGWVIDPNNNGVDPAALGEIHSGQKAARLGFNNQLGFPEGDAILFQDISGICPGKHYELQFEMNGEVALGNALVDVRVIWLDGNKNSIGLGLQIIVPKNSLPDDGIGAWTTFQGVTNEVLTQTQFARVQFEIHATNPDDQHVHLDDVSFVLL